MGEAGGVERRRVVTWSDPKAAAQAGRGMAGLEYLRAMRDGVVALPPVIRLLGIEMTEVEAGRVVMRLQPGEHLFNPLGTVHGGMIATLLDSVMGCAVHSTLPQGRGYTTLEIKVNFLHAVTDATGMVSAEGRVVQAGRQAAVAEGRLTDAAGKLHAVASTTCLAFDLPPGPEVQRQRLDALADMAGLGWEGDLAAMREGRTTEP